MTAKVNFAAISIFGFMWRKLLSQGLYFQLFGMFVPVLVYFQCNTPSDNTICRVFAEYAVYIMLFFFVSGFIALAVKKPYFMLFSWVCAIILCQFLKGNPEGTFYYTKVQDKKNTVSIAHFSLRGTEADLLFFDKIKTNKVDLISVSFDADFNSKVKDDIAQNYPHIVDLGPSKEAERNYLFSKFIISYFKNSVDDNVHCSSGQIILDSIEGKKISLLCFSIDDEIADNPQKLSKSLVSISNLKKRAKANAPLMVLGNVASYAWENELRSFRTNMLVNDSRLDLDLEKSGRHIFFSDELKCVSYESFENGVVGTYEIRKQRKNQIPKDFISAR